MKNIFAHRVLGMTDSVMPLASHVVIFVSCRLLPMRQGELVRAIVILPSSLYDESVFEEGERVRPFDEYGINDS